MFIVDMKSRRMVLVPDAYGENDRKKFIQKIVGTETYKTMNTEYGEIWFTGKGKQNRILSKIAGCNVAGKGYLVLPDNIKQKAATKVRSIFMSMEEVRPW